MMIFEVNFLHEVFGFSADERQFPLFCMPMAYGIFMLCLTVKIKENTLSAIGREYSLGIYIVHNICIYLVYHFSPLSYKTPSLLTVPVVLLLSIFSLVLMRKYANKAFVMLNGGRS